MPALCALAAGISRAVPPGRTNVNGMRSWPFVPEGNWRRGSDFLPTIVTPHAIPFVNHGSTIHAHELPTLDGWFYRTLSGVSCAAFRATEVFGLLRPSIHAFPPDGTRHPLGMYPSELTSTCQPPGLSTTKQSVTCSRTLPSALRA
jgi:hypothetical protein